MINVQPNSCELVPLSQSRLHEEKNCKINPWNDQSASVEKTSTYIWIEKMQLSLSDTCSNTLYSEYVKHSDTFHYMFSLFCSKY